MQHQFATAFQIAETPPPLELAVIVPTLNENGNVGRLLDRLAIALAGIEWEVTFVDDGSTDGTIEFLTAASRRDRRVRVIRRFGRRGLSSAVLEGMLASTAPVVAVIDADLQHDEQLLPDLYHAVQDGSADLAVGTRYADGGSSGDWSASRRAISRVATKLAVAVTGTELSDPMSGFFAIARDRLIDAAPHVSGIGYKILLDLTASSPIPLRVRELPYTFRTRDAGRSKLDGVVAFQYLDLLIEKSVGRRLPIPFLKFGVLGATAIAAQVASFGICLRLFDLSFGVADAAAIACVIVLSVLARNQGKSPDRRRHGLRLLGACATFAALCGPGAIANLDCGLALAVHEPWWLAATAGAAIGSLWNWAMCTLLARTSGTASA